VYYPFDGPEVGTPSRFFPNPYHYTNLLVTTRVRLNDRSLHTALEVKQNYVPMGLVCEDHVPAPGMAKHSSCDDGDPPSSNFGSLAEVNKAHGLSRGKTYRVVLGYDSRTLPSAKKTVSFGWVYTNHHP
jgi:hypothetical protein